jgi:hypothetical protein
MKIGSKYWFIGQAIEKDLNSKADYFLDEGTLVSSGVLGCVLSTAADHYFLVLKEHLYNSSEEALIGLFNLSKINEAN